MIQEGQSGQPEFLGLVKIRIGEPLTAIQIDESKVIFGSISGYIGYYGLQSKKTNYFQPINQQIIRGIYSEDNRLYFSIGDRHVLIKDMLQKKDERINIVRSHTNNICSHSMTMMYKLKQVIFCAFPTQKRQTIRIYQVTQQLICSKRKTTSIRSISPKIKLRSTGNSKYLRFMFPLTLMAKGYYGCSINRAELSSFKAMIQQKSKSRLLRTLGTSITSYPLVRFCRRKLSSLRIIKISNYQICKIMQLWICTRILLQSQLLMWQNDKTSISDLYLSIFNGIYKQWKNNSVVKTVKLWQSKNVPQLIKKHQYLFDMGYPYYIKALGNIVAITTDLGLCIFRI